MEKTPDHRNERSTGAIGVLINLGYTGRVCWRAKVASGCLCCCWSGRRGEFRRHGPRDTGESRGASIAFQRQSDIPWIEAGNIVAAQPLTVNAWVRALPGQQIQLLARVKSLTGPAGNVPASSLRWSGSMAKATGGGVAASCTSGTFADSLAESLISGWTRSGIVACDLTFSLATDIGAPTGIYTTEIDLALAAQ